MPLQYSDLDYYLYDDQPDSDDGYLPDPHDGGPAVPLPTDSLPTGGAGGCGCGGSCGCGGGHGFTWQKALKWGIIGLAAVGLFAVLRKIF